MNSTIIQSCPLDIMKSTGMVDGTRFKMHLYDDFCLQPIPITNQNTNHIVVLAVVSTLMLVCGDYYILIA